MLTAPHRVGLSDGFSVWKTCFLRAAGFPADRMASLACGDYAAEVDRWLDELGRVDAIVVARLASITERRIRRWYKRASEQLRAGIVPEPAPELDPALATELEQLRAARARLDQLQRDSQRQVAAFLRSAVRDAWFREAVIWQNRSALHTAFDVVARSSIDETDAKTRAKEELVAKYLQRYCTKNETIGFFGPLGLATLSRDAARTTCRPGPRLLSYRRVFFEHWCIAAVAEVMAADPGIKAWIAPRRNPTVRVEGEIVHHAGGSAEVPLVFARALALCDGRRPATAIAQQLAADEAHELADADEGLAILDELEQRGLISWQLEVPGSFLDPPERWLRRFLQSVGDEPARARALQQLDELEAARDAVARAAGDPEALDAALATFEAGFSAVTGKAPTRNAGRMYAGRTLLFEECRRDLQLELGADVLDQLARPLSLLMQSARWYTHQIAQRYRQELRALYERLKSEHGSATIDYVRFFEAAELLFGDPRKEHPVTAPIARELQARWRALLAFEPGEPRVRRASADLARGVAETFAAPCAGWPGARYHSPDLQIAASGLEALARGELAIVLGELHAGTNTVPPLLRVHPAPGEAAGWYDLDIPEPRVDFVSRGRNEARADGGCLAGRDFDVEVGSAISHRDRDHVLAIGDLVVDELGGELVVRTRDGAHSFDIVAFHERQIATATINHFRVLAPAPHLPRIAIDNLVISRERWTFDTAGLAFAQADTAGERFIRARRWARDAGLPRWVFYSVPDETKPVFLDFASPLLVEILVKHLRKVPAVTVTEMLPALDELWLEDATRRTYTSELRMVVVDEQPWSR